MSRLSARSWAALALAGTGVCVALYIETFGSILGRRIVEPLAFHASFVLVGSLLGFFFGALALEAARSSIAKLFAFSIAVLVVALYFASVIWRYSVATSQYGYHGIVPDFAGAISIAIFVLNVAWAPLLFAAVVSTAVLRRLRIE